MKEQITKIINEWDPIDLFPYSPKDEYKEEIDSVCKSLAESADIEELANNIHELFIERFGDDVFQRGYNECQNIAHKILDCME